MNDRLATSTVAILGFGNQGEAQALNLRANGLRVVVGARAGEGERRARAQGFTVSALDEAARQAGVVAVLLPDESLPELWSGVRSALPTGAGVVFAHGFNLLYGALDFPPGSDVVVVSPAGPGHVLKRLGEANARLAAYLAVHQDASGAAWALAEEYGRRLGCGPLWRTTVQEETEVDLFGEQVVLCGGMNALVQAAFETLVERGYTAEIAYLECVHQLKFLADLLHERGMPGFREAISSTALYGDLTRGPRVIGEASRKEMRAILDEIRSGSFAREWLAEVRNGRRRLDAEAARAARHPLDEARRRALGSGPGPDPEGAA